MWLAVRLVQNRSIAYVVGQLGKLLPLFAIATCGPLVLVLPTPTGAPPSIIVRAIHYCGIVLLFGFLIFGAFCQLEVWLRMRHRPSSLDLVAKTHRKWWIATRLIPAPAALCIALSGLRLAYESPLGFITYPWMFWLVSGFSFFFFDGLMFYLPEVSYQHKAVHESLENAESLDMFSRKHRKPWCETMLLIHSISFPFVFALGCAKPMALWRPDGVVNFLERLFPGITPLARFEQAAALVVMVALLLLALRFKKLIEYLTFLKSKPIVT